MTGTRRRLLAVVLLAGLGLAPGAAAAPNSVGQHHDDTASVVVHGTDGLTYPVSFELDATVGNPSQAAILTVSYKACNRSGSCGLSYTYELTLAASQVSYPDANTATVATTLLGKPLRLSWTAHPAAAVSGFTARLDVPNTVAVGDPTSGGDAGLSATFFGVACGGDGSMTNEYGAFATRTAGQSSGRRSVPAGFVAKRGRKPSCQTHA